MKMKLSVFTLLLLLQLASSILPQRHIRSLHFHLQQTGTAPQPSAAACSAGIRQQSMALGFTGISSLQHRSGRGINTRLFDTNIIPPVGNSTDLALGFSQLRPFLQIAVPFFREDEIARNSLLAVVGLTLLNSGVSVAFSYISRDFYNALNARNEPLFYEKIELFFGALLLAVPIAVFYRFVREKLAIYWREALTQNILDKFYAERTFYIVETMRDVDNPDQRIAEDIRRFTSTSLDFFITLFTSVIDLFAFSAILFQIYPPLFFAIVVYAGLGSLITTQLGRQLVSLNYERLQREANFRFALFRTRENAEGIAFYDNEAKLEREGVWELFKDALETQLGIAVAQRDLEYFTTSYRYIVQILPSLIVAPLYFAGKVELGAISQSYGAFNHILGDFSIIINQFEALSAFSAGLTRLATFIDRIENKGWGLMPLPDSGSKSVDKPLITMDIVRVGNDTSYDCSWLLRCKNLTVYTPDASRTIIGNIPLENSQVSPSSAALRGVSVEIRTGDQILIVGASGAGKSSFIRAIAGLWQVGSGTIQWNAAALQNSLRHNNDIEEEVVRSAPTEVFFLPQKPYNLLGSLKRQIMYPNINLNSSAIYDASKYAELEEQLPDEFFLDLLRKVRLDGLAERMGSDEITATNNIKDAAARGLRAVKDWSKVLSLGEQQRLAFARILFNQPAVVVLDEATSALDLQSEEAMYSLLQEMGVSYLSVGHRPTLLRYHRDKLVLRGAGSDPVKVPISQKSDEQMQELIDLANV